MKRYLAWFSSLVIRLIGSTLRMTIDDRGGIINRPDHPPVIVAFWHNRMALSPLFFQRYCRGRVAVTFISRSRDGQFIADVAARFGIKAVRGSSSRHGTSAMLSAIRAARDQHVDLVITPDGPRGPLYQMRPGLIHLAQMTERPIVAVSYQLQWKVTLNSWDRFQVPLPFSKCRLTISEPIVVPVNASESELAVINERIMTGLIGD